MSDFQPQTTFYLLKNIKIDHSNTNQILFDSKEQQQSYFMSHKAFEVLEGTYQRKTIGVINVPFLYDDIADCNYVMWQNGNYSDKWYYAFILNIKYVNPNLSQIVYDLDVIQTYMFDVEFKECYINRQHEQRYDSNGLPIVNTEVEDLEYGADYQTIYEKEITQIENVGFLVVGYTYDLKLLSGSIVNKVPLNIKYIIFPVYLYHATNGEELPDITFTMNGKTLTSGESALSWFATSTDLVNTCVSVKLYPFLPGAISATKSGNTIDLSITGYTIKTLKNTIVGFEPMTNIGVGSNYEIITTNKYENTPNYSESKLLMFPYTYGVLTTKRGHDFIIKHEYLNDKSISLLRQCSISNNPKVGYIIVNYLAKENAKLYGKIPYDQAQGIIETIENDGAIIDDYTASYLQSNSNSIKVSQSNAKLMQQSAIERANNTYDTGTQVRDIKTQQANRNLTTSLALTAINATANATRSRGLISAVVGTTADVASGTLSAITQKQTADENIRITAMQEQNSLKNANISANTDYQASIATINAKVQDASCVPPTSKQLGGDYVFDALYDCNGVYYQIKTITPYWAEKLSNYFSMYGYVVNKLGIPNLNTRNNWNYVKLVQANIFGNIPQSDLLKIRDIYMEGITLWHTDDVGNYTLSNDEIDNTTATIELFSNWTTDVYFYVNDVKIEHDPSNISKVTYPWGTKLNIRLEYPSETYQFSKIEDTRYNMTYTSNGIDVVANNNRYNATLIKKV